MNEAQICLLLNLMLPDQFYQAHISQGGGVRGSGRTTRMMVRALEAVALGQRIYLVAFSLGYARQLTEKLRVWAAKLNLNGTLILVPRPSAAMTGLAAKAFVDHSVTPDKEPPPSTVLLGEIPL